MNLQISENPTLWPDDTRFESIRAQVYSILSPSNPYVVPKDPSTVRQTLIDLALYIQTLEQELISARKHDAVSKGDLFTGSPSTSVYDGIDIITDGLDKFVVSETMASTASTGTFNPRFFGKSSNFVLLKEAMDIKDGYTGDEVSIPHMIDLKRPQFWTVHSVSNACLIFRFSRSPSSLTSPMCRSVATPTR